MICLLALWLAAQRPIYVLHDGYVIGACIHGKWRSAELSWVGRTIPGRLRDVGLGKLGATYAGGRIYSDPEEGPEAPDVDLKHLSGEPMYAEDDFGTVTVSTTKLSVPRKVTEIRVTSKTYAKAAHAYLARRRLGDRPFHITRIVKADLDGDGTDEVLIEGLSMPKLWLVGIDRTGHSPAHGQFAAVLLRYVGKDKKPRMRALILERCPMTGVAEVERLTAIADLDGDGVMEVVDSGRYYEGDWATIYRYRKGKVKTLAQMGCGA